VIRHEPTAGQATELNKALGSAYALAGTGASAAVQVLPARRRAATARRLTSPAIGPQGPGYPAPDVAGFVYVARGGGDFSSPAGVAVRQWTLLLRHPARTAVGNAVGAWDAGEPAATDEWLRQALHAAGEAGYL
jgi:hypothetical protein